MKKEYYLLYLVAFLAFSSCTKKHPKTDNIFKFKEYISFNTFGNASIEDPIRVVLAKPTSQFEATQEIPSEYLIINPKTEGSFSIENGTQLLFKPEEALRPDTEYTITLKLSRFFEDIDPEFKNYTFGFKTITPNFKINLGNLQSYSKEWQYLTGSIETSDWVAAEKAKQLVSASQEGKTLHIDWPTEETKGTFFNFTIDSIHRKKENSQIRIAWNGESITSATQGQSTLNIPGQANFTLVDVVST